MKERNPATRSADGVDRVKGAATFRKQDWGIDYIHGAFLTRNLKNELILLALSVEQTL